jgi:hypothetical protein
MLALAHHRPVKGDAEPGQILDHALGMIGRQRMVSMSSMRKSRRPPPGGPALAEHR